MNDKISRWSIKQLLVGCLQILSVATNKKNRDKVKARILQIFNHNLIMASFIHVGILTRHIWTLQYNSRGKNVTKPFAKGIGSDNIQLEWETENELEQGHCFEIYYKIHNEGRWVQYLSKTPCKLTRILIENLQPQTSYILR